MTENTPGSAPRKDREDARAGTGSLLPDARPWLRGEEELLACLRDHGATRDDVAAVYAACIAYASPVDWPAVNKLIIEAWSKSGLVWIKTQAWKRVEGLKAATGRA